jgi:hypothetical protein
MKHLLKITLLAILISGCQSKETNQGTPLFNGKDFSGWRFYKGRENNSWEVVDGVLHCKPFG